MRKICTLALSLVIVTTLPLAVQAQQRNTNEQADRKAEQQRRFQEEFRAERPIEALNSVWIEELTWMEVRDALSEGKTTAIISTGGIEQNGPYLATGKHNYVLQGACEGIARKLGDALCAPIIKLVPEGEIDEPSGHMRYPGTISLRQETFEAVLDDVGSSLKAHGFKHIVYIGDSGGNQSGMKAVAERLNKRWKQTIAHHIPEFYRYADVFDFMDKELGIVQTANDGIHDDFVITSIMMTENPETVRYEQRIAANKASINGLSITPKQKTVEIGQKLLQFRVDETVRAIRTAIGLP